MHETPTPDNKINQHNEQLRQKVSHEDAISPLSLAKRSIEKVGISSDSRNVWNSVGTLRPLIENRSNADVKTSGELSSFLPIILKEPLQTYEEYMKSKHSESEVLAYVLEHSDHGVVERFDELVSQANAIRDQLLEMSDENENVDAKIDTVRDLLEIQRKAGELINGTSEVVSNSERGN